jgi:tetratricopeptide (TPR) repeat protein
LKGLQKMMQKALSVKLIITLVAILFAQRLYAQDSLRNIARTAMDAHNYEQAIKIYKPIFDTAPNLVYSEYLDALIGKKDFKTAERVVSKQAESRLVTPITFIDLGHVYDAAGKDKKAAEQYQKAIQFVNGDDMLTQQMVKRFSAVGRDIYAIQTLERARQILGNTPIYNGQLAKLYAKTGDMDKVVTTLLDGSAGLYNNPDATKTTMLEVLGTDQNKMQLVQKALIKRINAQPENNYYIDLLTWLYTQKNDWDGALLQIEAMDLRNKESGQRLIDFARMALHEKQYDIAIKAYGEVMDKGADHPAYNIAASGKLNAEFVQLQNNPAYTVQQVKALEVEYDTFLSRTPTYYTQPTAREYATLAGQYDNNPRAGVAILKTIINDPNTPREFAGSCKLQMGDYYVLIGTVWEASLLYSQVDKDFKNDALGEEARFRNAKLSYYRGDFPYAQEQLSVLKASTSELIANDALYLSVLITENTAKDSINLPFERFAYADLLLFQNRDKEAEALLDSIANAYPKHPLNDDILMLRAKIADKHRDYPRELDYLRTIYEKYGKDVLGDDAVYKTALIYDTNLHKPEEARSFYEKLIIDYPGSTFVQTARARLAQLNNPAIP